MTEAEWSACVDPMALPEFHWDRTSDRKVRLVGCAICRAIWIWMLAPECRAAVEASEEFADRLISADALDRRSAAAQEAYEDAVSSGGIRGEVAAAAAFAASYATSPSLTRDVLTEALGAAAEVSSQGILSGHTPPADFIRDIFGNPSRPATFSPSWLTSPVLALARSMYGSRDFAAMPILADALEEAGCDNSDVLKHCRGTGPHARGCWVVDAVLGRG